MVYYRRRRNYRKYGRGKVSSFRYTPVLYHTHRYRNSFAYVSTAGFYDSLEKKGNVICEDNDTPCKSKNKNTSYINETQEFQSFFPDMFAPRTKQSQGAPYFQSSEELDCLLARYSKYKLVSVKHVAKNFKCLQITVRCRSSSVTEADRLLAQKYLIQKYGGGGNLSVGTIFALPADKFDITYQYVPFMHIEKVYRNHTVVTDSNIISGDIIYGAGDAPVKVHKVSAKSVMKNFYYPTARAFLDSALFYKDKYNGNFKTWLDAMGVTNYPNLTYARLSMGPDQYVDSDINTCHFNVLFCDICTYYRFKFGGINNLDVQ